MLSSCSSIKTQLTSLLRDGGFISIIIVIIIIAIITKSFLSESFVWHNQILHCSFPVREPLDEISLIFLGLTRTN